ncbi:RNA-binding protein 34, partial [Tanacetum coccineum]
MIIIKDDLVGEYRVNAYIVFKTEDSAQASLAHNMAVVGGNHIHVDRACPPRKKLKGENAPLYDSKRTVFIGNLPFDVKDEELYQLFSSFNNLKDCIEAIRVVRDPGTSMGKGIAYVLFTTR